MYHHRAVYRAEATKQNINQQKEKRKRLRSGERKEKEENVQQEKTTIAKRTVGLSIIWRWQSHEGHPFSILSSIGLFSALDYSRASKWSVELLLKNCSFSIIKICFFSENVLVSMLGKLVMRICYC